MKRQGGGGEVPAFYSFGRSPRATLLGRKKWAVKQLCSSYGPSPTRLADVVFNVNFRRARAPFTSVRVTRLARRDKMAESKPDSHLNDNQRQCHDGEGTCRAC